MSYKAIAYWYILVWVFVHQKRIPWRIFKEWKFSADEPHVFVYIYINNTSRINITRVKFNWFGFKDKKAFCNHATVQCNLNNSSTCPYWFGNNGIAQNKFQDIYWKNPNISKVFFNFTVFLQNVSQATYMMVNVVQSENGPKTFVRQ